MLDPAELKPFAGQEGGPVYIAIIGDVFDVTTGRKHYDTGRSYGHFAGCDASRAFVTGVDDGKGVTDDLSGLSDEQLKSIASWHEFYMSHENYTRVGRVSGRFFDSDGTALEKFPWERLKAAEQKEEALKKEFPGCNSRWTQATGSEVWCTAKSGGIARDWAGVPRLMTLPEGSTQKERCACVQPERAQLPQLRLYPECSPYADRCKVIKPKKAETPREKPSPQ